MTGLGRITALKSGLSFLLSVISLEVFAAAGLAARLRALLMMLALLRAITPAALGRELSRSPLSEQSLQRWSSK